MNSLAPPSPLRSSSRNRSAPNSPGMIPTSADSRLSLSVTNPVTSETGEGGTDQSQTEESSGTSSTQPKRKKKKAKKKKPTEIEISSESNDEQPSRKKAKSKKNIPAPTELDLDQDNGVPESVGTSSVGIRSQQAKDVIELRRYFKHPPEHVGKETGPNPRGYTCRHCHGTYAKGPSGWSNLYSHRDGSESRPVCVARHLATDLNLPPTYKERLKAAAEKDAEKNKGSSGTLDKFVSVVKFNVDIFNQVMVI